MVDSADKDQKTEEATSKRLADARQEGQMPVSRELATWFMFIAMLSVVAWFGPVLGEKMTVSMRVFLEAPHQLSLEDGGLQNVLIGVFVAVALPATIIYGLFWASSILGTMIQTGFDINPTLVKLDVTKLIALKGFKSLFSMNSFAELAKGFAKMVVMGYVAYIVLVPVFSHLPSLVDVPLLQGLAFLHDQIFHIIAVLMLIITAIAIGDTLYVRYTYFKGLRMTKQEVKDENKQMEGDPMIKGRLRRIRLEKARQRMMSNVPGADVVITNPTHYAVAMKYDNQKMVAPIVVAKGTDKIAARIRDLAEESGVPLVSNPTLARALYDTVDVDEAITPEHYRAVAEIISYVYKLKKKAN